MHLLQQISGKITRGAQLSLLCLSLTSVAWAENNAPLLSGPWSEARLRADMTLAQMTQSTQLTPQTEPATQTSLPQTSAEKSKPARETAEGVEAPWYGRNNVHKYLGLGSIAAAALTVASPKGYDGPHEMFAKAAAALGGAAIVSGVYAHWDDLDFTFQDPDTKHALFGILGTLGYAAAIAADGKGSHAAAGALGALSMIVSIKYTW